MNAHSHHCCLWPCRGPACQKEHLRRPQGHAAPVVHCLGLHLAGCLRLEPLEGSTRGRENKEAAGKGSNRPRVEVRGGTLTAMNHGLQANRCLLTHHTPGGRTAVT